MAQATGIYLLLPKKYIKVPPLCQEWRDFIMENNLYTTGKVAEMLGISKSTIKHWVKVGKLKPAKITETGRYLFSEEQIEQLRLNVQQRYGIPLANTDFFVGTGVLKNHAYDFNDQEIRVLYKDGSCRDISEASDQLDRHFLEKQVTKYYLFFPKEPKASGLL